MIDVVGMIEWLFAALLALVAGPLVVFLPVVVGLWLILTGRLVRSPRPEPCEVCKLRSLTLGVPGLVRCDHGKRGDS